jgi:hypothetical protein
MLMLMLNAQCLNLIDIIKLIQKPPQLVATFDLARMLAPYR